jgi:hypothetical protein
MNGAKGAKAGLLETDAYRQAVQTQVIANIANSYYTLLMLDKQLEITEKTATTWGEQVRAMKALKNLGMTNEATVAKVRLITIRYRLRCRRFTVRSAKRKMPFRCCWDRLRNV